ncbi:MAG: hydratase [Alphaproteobacteria bacterium]|jgi:2-keto-4-pentenoate hydratase|nr:hydratase [Alphaproteobacteria bacterium]
MDHEFEKLVSLLANARESVRQIPALDASLIPSSTDLAYRINSDVATRLGWEPLGWKIAATTDAVRAKLKTDGPIYGRTYRRFRHESPARLSHGELLDPLVECEFFCTLAHPLPAREQPWTMEEIVGAIGSVHAGIEVAECRFPSRALPPLPAILADGSASGRYVFGGPIENWRDALTTMEVRLEVDGRDIRGGTGADVMGDPLRPLLWLAEERRRFGDGLRAGETISTGSVTGMLPIRPGQRVIARFGDQATVEIDFVT